MQSSTKWLRDNLKVPSDLDEEELERAGEPPSDSVYRRMAGVKWLIIHHSATASGCARVFRAFHRAVRGWEDIGYHFVVGNGTLSGDGELEKGRPAWAAGAHTKGSNDDSIGICLVGDFTSAAPTPAQLETLGRLLGELMDRFGLTPSNIMFHRDAPGCSTECPGRNLSLEAVRGLVQVP